MADDMKRIHMMQVLGVEAMAAIAQIEAMSVSNSECEGAHGKERFWNAHNELRSIAIKMRIVSGIDSETENRLLTRVKGVSDAEIVPKVSDADKLKILANTKR